MYPQQPAQSPCSEDIWSVNEGCASPLCQALGRVLRVQSETCPWHSWPTEEADRWPPESSQSSRGQGGWCGWAGLYELQAIRDKVLKVHGLQVPLKPKVRKECSLNLEAEGATGGFQQQGGPEQQGGVQSSGGWGGEGEPELQGGQRGDRAAGGTERGGGGTEQQRGQREDRAAEGTKGGDRAAGGIKGETEQQGGQSGEQSRETRRSWTSAGERARGQTEDTRSTGPLDVGSAQEGKRWLGAGK